MLETKRNSLVLAPTRGPEVLKYFIDPRPINH